MADVPPEEGIQIDPAEPDYAPYFKFSGRIGDLLEFAEARDDNYLRGTLDLFLGAIYALVLAKYTDYSHRHRPPDADKILIRARAVEGGRIRLHGKWLAGFHFNSALFRLSSVYHRSLKIVAGRVDDRESTVRGLVTGVKADPSFTGWGNGCVHAVHVEVTDLKHQPEGLYEKRDVTPIQALHACEEILKLLETWKASA